MTLERNLVLIRHASAEERSWKMSDAERALTEKGLYEAKALSKAAKRLGVEMPDVVMTSGYVRAEETLASFEISKATTIVRDLIYSPEAPVLEATRHILAELNAMGKSKSKTVWIVGHNPHLESVLQVLAPTLFDFICHLEKASLVWLQWDSETLDAGQRPYLRAFLPRPSH